MSEELSADLIEAFHSFKTRKYLQNENLCHSLDETSLCLARDKGLRHNLPNSCPTLWEDISDIWKAVESDLTEGTVTHGLILSLARFMRNLVAGVPSNQEEAFSNEPQIRHILHNLTSFSQLKDENLYPLTRMLVQTLSNFVTLNDSLATRLWDLYMTLPEEQNILTRLLASPDIHTITATLVLILNSINAEERALSRLTSQIGLRILVQVLDLTEEWIGREIESNDQNEAFLIAFRLFENLLKQDLGPTLYRVLHMEDEPITPHQTSFLKIIDSCLQQSDERPHTLFYLGDYSFLVESFLSLCSYLRHAIRRSLGTRSPTSPSLRQDITFLTGSTPKEDLKELDLRLPKVFAALILLSQCLISICLRPQYDADNGTSQSGSITVVTATLAEGFVEDLVETLRLVDQFLPRIVFGQAVTTPGQANTQSASSADGIGFAYLKRDLVRLLGIICHERKDIQDRVRECGGIQVVMNLCVIDERNPYLQEHALFALRNILYENAENQRVVEAMQPQR